MRTSIRLGIVGSSVAVLGSAAFAGLAPSAVAASGKAHATPTYNSTATSKFGAVTIDGTPENVSALTATTGNSPKAFSLGTTTLATALGKVPYIGSLLSAALPHGLNLLDQTATATAAGTSTACAGVLVGTCGYPATPVTLTLSVAELATALGLPDTGLPAGLDVVLTLHGPQASCEAGRGWGGWGGFGWGAHASAAGVTADITDNGQSVLSAAVNVTSGDIFAQLDTALAAHDPTLYMQLGPVLKTLATEAPLGVIVDPSTTEHTAGPKTSATAGELGLTTTIAAAATTLFDVKGVEVSCGPNTGGSGPGPKPKPGAGKTGGEKPLGGIQSDEGRSSLPANSWQALNGMP